MPVVFSRYSYGCILLFPKTPIRFCSTVHRHSSKFLRAASSLCYYSPELILLVQIMPNACRVRETTLSLSEKITDISCTKSSVFHRHMPVWIAYKFIPTTTKILKTLRTNKQHRPYHLVDMHIQSAGTSEIFYQPFCGGKEGDKVKELTLKVYPCPAGKHDPYKGPRQKRRILISTSGRY